MGGLRGPQHSCLLALMPFGNIQSWLNFIPHTTSPRDMFIDFILFYLFICLFLKISLILRERGREGGREGEKHPYEREPLTSCDPICNPGMCPNCSDPSLFGMTPGQLSHTQSGLFIDFRERGREKKHGSVASRTH